MAQNQQLLSNKFLDVISKIIDYKLTKTTHIASAKVYSVNDDDTVNIIIPPDQKIYHRIQNQSIYKLQSGDSVKIIKENNSLSNMWIIGGCNLSKKRWEV